MASKNHGIGVCEDDVKPCALNSGIGVFRRPCKLFGTPHFLRS
jgi:hypothetical protein